MTEKSRAATKTGSNRWPISDNRYSTRSGFSPKSVLSINRLYQLIEAGADSKEPVLVGRITELQALRDQAHADADRAAALMDKADAVVNHAIQGVNAGYITRHKLLDTHLRKQQNAISDLMMAAARTTAKTDDCIARWLSHREVEPRS